MHKEKYGVIQNDADKGWTFFDGDGNISAQDAFADSDVGLELKAILKVKVGIDLGKLWGWYYR